MATPRRVTKEYVWGGAIDELIILKIGAEIYYAYADALGWYSRSLEVCATRRW